MLPHPTPSNKMASKKELEGIWADIEPLAKKYNQKIIVADVEYCHTCVLGPYISLTIKKSEIFFLIDYLKKNVEIKYHVDPNQSALEFAIVVRVLMMNRVFPFHVKTLKVSKSD